MDLTVFNQGLLIMGLGMAGVFMTLIIFYLMIFIFNRTMKDKPVRED